MKKLKLNLQEIEGAEILTREQLKRVLGGKNCGVLIDGYWRQIYPSSSHSGTKDIAISYVNNDYASRWCCDSCSHW